MCQFNESVDWKVAHDALVSLAKRRAAYDLEEGRWLLAGWRAEVHTHVGMASYSEYLGRLFGYAPREVAERLRVARALEALPRTAAALGAGELCPSAARELTRVATDATEEDWLRAADGKTVRQVEALVSGRRVGDLPTDPVSQQTQRHVLRFEVRADTYALWREAVGELRRQAGGGALDDDDALLLMARQVLGGPPDEGRASYQVALTRCDDCGRATQDAHGAVVVIDDTTVEMAQCDAQHIGHVDAASSHAANPNTTPTTHVGRATQTIPPATRRRVLRRDHGRCVVDGCANATFVDVHHLDPRAEGGTHDPARLVTLCGAHHRAVHQGRLLLEGTPSALRCLHADRSAYGRAVDPAAVDARTQAFAALRHLGFKESPARAALQTAAATHVGADLRALVRAALAVLTR